MINTEKNYRDNRIPSHWPHLAQHAKQQKPPSSGMLAAVLLLTAVHGPKLQSSLLRRANS